MTSTLVCLVPILFSLLVYDRLPDQVAIHWNTAGVPDNFASKPIAAFGLPVLLAAMFVHFTINNDPKRVNQSPTLKMIAKWTVPVIALIVFPITLFIAMGYSVPIQTVVPALVGVLIVVVGNYLPKCKQNYTVGIRLPWTLNNTENWNKTHRLAGYVWTIGGILMILNAFMNFWYATAGVIFLLAAIPFGYSYLLYKRGY